MMKMFSAFDERAEVPSGNAFAEIDDILLFTEALIGRHPNAAPIIAPETFGMARQNQTGDMPLESVTAAERYKILLQILRTAPPSELAAARKAAGEGQGRTDGPVFPANFTLLGSYVRGEGDFLSPAGRTASPTTIAAVGGASTSFVVDTERDLTLIFLSAGFVEGSQKLERLERFADLAIGAIR
ncbi:hypothetical protein [Bradyrhizobium sp. ERR14]|uniref:hypothetical protein n=1 Tax=Bradyrhizobium sp. ERR14 TaxID=2663837 RepID=UPI00162313CC|nr:hypothetical protein [Bradyrhizobium sp. ERR14]MBB4399158.1 CubicO group peptidase (beta-lactamase class C family) [Bradyrhizobium sp. ERR14]